MGVCVHEHAAVCVYIRVGVCLYVCRGMAVNVQFRVQVRGPCRSCMHECRRRLACVHVRRPCHACVHAYDSLGMLMCKYVGLVVMCMQIRPPCRVCVQVCRPCSLVLIDVEVCLPCRDVCASLSALLCA